jgi:hypothetical protein
MYLGSVPSRMNEIRRKKMNYIYVCPQAALDVNCMLTYFFITMS